MERLLKLAAFLETLDPEKFKFSRFVEHHWKGDPLLSCGTVACALGWTPTVFPEVTMSQGPTWKQYKVPDFEVEGIEIKDFSGFRTEGQAALAKFFGLTASEYDHLFLPNCSLGRRSGLRSNVSPETVAANIRSFVKERTNFMDEIIEMIRNLNGEMKICKLVLDACEDAELRHKIQERYALLKEGF